MLKVTYYKILTHCTIGSPRQRMYKEQSGKPRQIVGMRIQYFEAES